MASYTDEISKPKMTQEERKEYNRKNYGFLQLKKEDYNLLKAPFEWPLSKIAFMRFIWRM